jgi:hypothetical protein
MTCPRKFWKLDSDGCHGGGNASTVPIRMECGRPTPAYGQHGAICHRPAGTLSMCIEIVDPWAKLVSECILHFRGSLE